jgi:hypothetical protein
MTDRFLITPHSTTLTYRIGEGGKSLRKSSSYRVDIVSQVVIGVYGSLEEAQQKTELEEKLKSTRKLRM